MRIRKATCKRGHPRIAENLNGRSCRVCQKEAQRIWHQGEKSKVYKRLYQQGEKFRTYRKKWYGENRERALATILFRRYSLTPQDVATMLDKQQNRCAICLRGKDEFSKFHIDHNHTTGKVRGLLCPRCNSQILRVVESTPQLVSAAFHYLEVA